MQTENDALLVQRARGGDKRAFGELITRHQTTIQRVVYHLVRDHDLARDLAQEALLAAYLSLDQLRDDARFASWLYGIALNVCRSHLRDHNIAMLSFEQIAGGVTFNTIPFSSEPDPQAVAETRELHERVLDAIKALSPENRAATLLFYYDGLSLDEIATLLQISVGAVKGRLHKSRARLRQELFAIYAEHVSYPVETKGSKTMIPVTIADVVRRERKDKEGNVISNHIVVLYDAQGQRTLPIWVGPFEGGAIAIGVAGEPIQRPMTFEFFAKLLEAADAKIESVRIDSLKEDVFYAAVAVRSGDKSVEIDARPSDAMALALRTGTQIYVTPEVFEKAGVPVPRPVEIHSPPRGIQALMQEFQAGVKAGRAQFTEEETKQAQRELVELVFGA
jgi:RNA polymerase sigma factor (sigma-70 family)